MLAVQEVATITSAPEAWEDKLYRSHQLKGVWQPAHTLLLENRIYKGQVGVEVFTPFRLDNDTMPILVNRGWLATAEQEDTVIGDIQVTLSGIIYAPEKPLAIGDSILPEVMASKRWPKKSLYLDMPVFAEVLKIPIQPVVLVLDENDPAAFTKIWKAVVMTPAKHFGYAVQWLGLALTFIVYGVIWFRKKKHKL